MTRWAGGRAMLRPALLLLIGGGIARAAALPAVIAVYPSGPELPQRVLRISLRFAGAPDGPVLPALSLRADDGGVIDGWAVQQELWSPDRRTLSVLFDPARVKTGLLAHDQAGWALSAGSAVTLSVGGVTVHRWHVVAGGCVVPDLAEWRLQVPRAATRDPLRVAFPGPIDAQSAGLIAVSDAAGARVAGEARLLDGERAWVFAPAVPWPPATFALLAHPRLEDPCGDEIAEAFEHADGHGLGSQRTVPRRNFTIN